MKNKKQVWQICIVAVVFIIILTFSPLVTGKGKINPFILGLPYTLWMGILLTVVLVVITFIAGNALPNEEEGEK